MISSVRGTVLAVHLDHAVVEVGGVGLAVQAAPGTLSGLRRGTEATLATALIVREDSLTLYGFPDGAARELFTLLQTVSGVGPRLAMAALAVLEPDVLRSALADGNLAVLTQVPGVGRKGAERMVIELRDKVGALPGAGSSPPVSPGGGLRTQVVDALIGLGFTAKQVEQTVDAVLAETDGADRSSSAVLRTALTRLGRSR